MKKPLAFMLTGILVLSWLVLPATGCDNKVVKETSRESSDVFSIYLLAEKLEGEPPYDLDKLTLQAKPWLSVEDIAYYDFSTHYIYLKEDKASLLSDEIPTATVYPFVVVANGERCYLGHFVSPVSSYLPTTPFISDYPGFELYPEDIIYIANYSPDGAADPRNDRRIRDALAKAGKLSLGLSVTLSEVKVNSRDGTTGVSYTFAVTNESNEPLNVPDPDKMRIGLFHYYTGGIILYGSEVYSTVLSTPYDPAVAPQPHDSEGDTVWITSDSWDSSWFARLGSHESMERTITFTCDQIVSQGTYSCSFRYTGPSRIEKGDRALSDGRLWIGMIVASHPIEISTD